MAKKSIQDVLDEYSIDIHKEGTVLRAFCPFHKDTSKPNLTIYLETNSWFCFACSEGGDPAQFVAKLEGIAYSEAKKKVEGVTVALDELQQEIDGLDPSERSLTFNDNVNLTVSQHCRAYLWKYPEAVQQVFQFLSTLDKELEQPVSYQKMQTLLQQSKQLFKIGE